MNEEKQKKREIELMVLWAENLAHVRKLGLRMKCYAEVYVDPRHKVRTHVDKQGGINPTWNERLVIETDEALLKGELAAITVDVYARGRISDHHAGTARVLVSQVLRGGDTWKPLDNPIQHTCLDVWHRGNPEGCITLWIPPTGAFMSQSPSSSSSLSSRISHSHSQTEPR